MQDSKIKISKQAEAFLPTEWGEFKMMAYAGNSNEAMPHYALISKKTFEITKTVNVRIHSECTTGDLFHSLRCDCGDQLAYSMKYLNKNGGILIYLRQEGRGIGIIHKLDAYVEQDKGLDTIEANEILGFPADNRSYNDAVTILNDLGIKKINLITNNPEKIEALEKSGIEVVERIPVIIKSNKINKKYLIDKKEKMGHLLD